MRRINKVTKIGSIFIKNRVSEGDTVIDATCGNGNDTLFFSNLVGKTGQVYSFDIQDRAIENTNKLLSEKSKYNNYEIIKDSFVNIYKYVEGSVDCIVYNLGYLPGSDKKLITKAEDTLLSLKKSLNLLSKDAIAVISSYRGHEGGKDEYLGLKNFLSELLKDEYNTLEINHLNRSENSPVLFVIEKL